jgi:hypothetical protein
MLKHLYICCNRNVIHNTFLLNGIPNLIKFWGNETPLTELTIWIKNNDYREIPIDIMAKYCKNISKLNKKYHLSPMGIDLNIKKNKQLSPSSDIIVFVEFNTTIYMKVLHNSCTTYLYEDIINLNKRDLPGAYASYIYDNVVKILK